MTAWIFMAGAVGLTLSLLLTLLIMRGAEALGLIDVPNERSSHAVPTPTGGGLAIVTSSVATLGLLTAVGAIPVHLFLALGPGGAAVAIVGFIDDRRSLSARIRLFVHFMAAAWAVLCIGPVDLFGGAINASVGEWLSYIVCTVGIVWFLNMFNFMDGIDAIAASEAVFLSAGTAVLSVLSLAISHISPAAAVIGAASVGFLLWNWPPAKIFMGDVGSGYLGFVFASLGLSAGTQSPSALCTCLILAGTFVVDPTFTVVRRFVRGERVTEAHRTHAFQLLAQRVGHRKATLTVTWINLVWLFPCALASALRPQDAIWLTVLALGPLVLCAFVMGAGRPQALPDTTTAAGVVIQFPLPEAVKRNRLAITPEHRGVTGQFSSSAVTDRKVHDVG